MKNAFKWTIGLILLGFVMAGIFLTLAPDRIPVHYNIRGEVDRWGSKYEYLVMPFCNLFFGFLMAWLARLEGKKGRDMNERIVSVMCNWILVVFNLMWAMFMWKVMDPGNLEGNLGDLVSRGILVLMSASMIPLGNIMPKSSRNGLFGLRTKWSMASDHCWQQSQRVGGYILVGTGILGVILTAVLPVTWGGIAVVALLLVAAAASTWASYRIWQKNQAE